MFILLLYKAFAKTLFSDKLFHTNKTVRHTYSTANKIVTFLLFSKTAMCYFTIGRPISSRRNHYRISEKDRHKCTSGIG